MVEKVENNIMKIEYIKANGKYYIPQERGFQDPTKIKGVFLPVCFIKKLFFGKWRIDYYDNSLYAYKNNYNNQEPASRIILYPNGIEEIKYLK